MKFNMRYMQDAVKMLLHDDLCITSFLVQQCQTPHPGATKGLGDIMAEMTQDGHEGRIWQGTDRQQDLLAFATNAILRGPMS